MSVLTQLGVWHSTAYSKVALCRFTSSQSLANLMRDLMFPPPQARDWSILHSLFLEFNGHLWLVGAKPQVLSSNLNTSQSVSQSVSPLASCLKMDDGIFTVSQRCAEGMFCFRVR